MTPAGTDGATTPEWRDLSIEPIEYLLNERESWRSYPPERCLAPMRAAGWANDRVRAVAHASGDWRFAHRCYHFGITPDDAIVWARVEARLPGVSSWFCFGATTAEEAEQRYARDGMPGGSPSMQKWTVGAVRNFGVWGNGLSSHSSPDDVLYGRAVVLTDGTARGDRTIELDNWHPDGRNPGHVCRRDYHCSVGGDDPDEEIAKERGWYLL